MRYLFVYIDTTDEDVSQPLFLTGYTLSRDRLKGFRVLEPWQVAPISVNSFNPLERDYMKPSLWYVLGAGQNVHQSRLIPVVFFEVPELLKPVFNYMGLPLSFYMKSFVASAEISRQCIADLMLRFRTDYIKTTAQKIADPETKARVKMMNATQNNFGKIFLSQDEELSSINTPLSGLDTLLSQMYELVTMTTGMPVTKFLGLSPRGFNATGEHDQNNYYDLIAGYQANIAAPVLNKLARAVCVLRLNADIKPQFNFNPLNRLTKTETAQLNNLKADYLKKLDELGIITAEDALRAVKEDDFSFNWIEDVPEQEEAGGLDMAALMGNAEQQTPQARVQDAADDFKEADHPRDEDGRFSKGNISTNGKENGKNTGQSAAQITITGKELGDFQTPKEWRQAARAYYDEHLKGKKANHPQLGKIEFSNKGIKEAIHHSCGIDKLKLIPYLREIIETGTAEAWRGKEHERTDGLVQFCDIKNTVNLNGKKEDVRVIIAKHANGKLFYELFLENQKEQQRQAQTQDKASASTDRNGIRYVGGLTAVVDNPITEPAYEVNIFFE